MKIIFMGDIYGRSGREAVERHLPEIIAQKKPDLVIANAENAAHGRGLTGKMADEFMAMGIDCITLGNHSWSQKDIIPYIQNHKNLLRPLNLPSGTPGNGVWEHELTDGRRVMVISLMLRTFMELSDDPFAAVDTALRRVRLGQNCQMIFVDVHGEATSEKYAMGHFLDGRVSAVIGSHSHVPTADAHILVGGTAYQTDAGMCGCYDSVVGATKQSALPRFLKKVPPVPLKPADGEGTLCGAFVETDDRSGLARSITPLRYGGVLPSAA